MTIVNLIWVVLSTILTNLLGIFGYDLNINLIPLSVKSKEGRAAVNGRVRFRPRERIFVGANLVG